jgi:hypothetical protein
MGRHGQSACLQRDSLRRSRCGPEESCEAERSQTRDFDDAGSVLGIFGGLNRSAKSIQIVDIIHGLHVPAIGGVSLENIFGEGEVGVAVDGDVVVVVEDDELPCQKIEEVLC